MSKGGGFPPSLPPVAYIRDHVSYSGRIHSVHWGDYKTSSSEYTVDHWCRCCSKMKHTWVQFDSKLDQASHRCPYWPVVPTVEEVKLATNPFWPKKSCRLALLVIFIIEHHQWSSDIGCYFRFHQISIDDDGGGFFTVCPVDPNHNTTIMFQWQSADFVLIEM